MFPILVREIVTRYLSRVWRSNATYVYPINIFFSIEASPPIRCGNTDGRIARKSELRARQQPRYVNEWQRARARARRHERGACTRQLDVAIASRRAPGCFRRVSPEDYARRLDRALRRGLPRDAGSRARSVRRVRSCVLRHDDASLIIAPPCWTSPLCRLIPVDRRRSDTHVRTLPRARPRENFFPPWRRREM